MSDLVLTSEFRTRTGLAISCMEAELSSGFSTTLATSVTIATKQVSFIYVLSDHFQLLKERAVMKLIGEKLVANRSKLSAE